ncbi:MAG: hypothetical protein PHP93_03875 [Kiritimatiellales bacterium]|nr:hypothetical protein [Kiritimatiellales bacterium]
MKNIFVFFVVVSGLASVSPAQSTVASANILGYTKINLAPGGKFRLISASFETAETNTLSSIFGTNQLAQSDFLAGCDIISMWDPATSKYQRWAQWTDGKFYKANDAAQWGNIIEGDPEVPMGCGFWIASAGSSTETNTILISGNVVSVSTQEVAIVQNYQMISYPFSSSIALNETTFRENGGSASDFLAGCDKISVWTGNGYQRYALWTDGKWYKANNAAEWGQIILATNIINLGEGVWYEAVTGFTWSETNRYSQVFE